MSNQDRKRSLKCISLFSITLAAIFMWGMSTDIQSSLHPSEFNNEPLVSDLVQSAHAQINQDTPTNITIGTVLPIHIDGPFERGAAWQYAADIAVDDFNNYLTEKDADWRLDLDSEDSEGKVSVTVDIVSQMYDDGIMFIVGPALSSGVSAVLNDFIIPNSADLVLVSPSSTAPDLAMTDNVYRLAVADEKQGKVIADMLYDDGKRIIIPIWANDPYGNGLAESTVTNFVANGGTVDYNTNPDDGIVRSYERCSNQYPTCIGDQFPDMAMELSNTVTDYIKNYGHDQIAILFVGFEQELEGFIVEAQAYPILRTVQWMGSDATATNPNLVIGDVGEFLTTVNFRSPFFFVNSDTDRHNNLAEMITMYHPAVEPSDVYVHSTYDSVWAIGLAIEAAGGLNASFNDIVAEIEPAVNNNDEGALGDITLDEYGDIDAGDYVIWGIESTSWEQIGVYYDNGMFNMMYEDPIPATNIGSLLSLGGITGVAPTSSVFLDSELAVTIALAEDDYNASYPNSPIKITTVDSSYGPLPALNNLDYGTYDDFYKPQLVALIENARDVYDAEGSFDSLEATVPYPSSTFSFSVDRTTALNYLDLQFEPRPPRYVDAGVSDVSVEEIFVLLSPDDLGDDWTPLPEIWTHFSSFTGSEIRALLTYHEPTDTILGAAYYTPVGGDDTHMPVLQTRIMNAIEYIEANNNDIDSLIGSYDNLSPFYTFVIAIDGQVLATSLVPTVNNSVIGMHISGVPNIDKTISEINNDLLENDYTWVSYTFNNPSTGVAEYKRALIMKADIGGTDYLFGSGYYPTESINQFVGPTSSANVSRIIEHVNMNDKIVVSPSSTATILAEEDNVFRLTPTNASQVLPLVELMKDEGITHVVIVQRDDVWGADLASELVNEDSFKSYTTIEPLPVDQTNFDYDASVMELESVLTSTIDRAGSADSVGVVHIVFENDMISFFTAIDMVSEDDSPIFSVNHYTTDGVANIDAVTDDLTTATIAYMLDIKGITFEPTRTETSLSLENRLNDLGLTYNAYHASVYDSVWLLAMANESTDEHTLRAILNSGGVDEDSEDLESLAVTLANNSPYPYMGALSDQGITLNSVGDLAVTSEDYGVFIIEKSDDTYSWILSPPTGTISGTIFVDNNGNGLFGADEIGISDVMVYMADSDGQTTYTMTDSNGSFVFEDIPAEEYTIFAQVNDSYNYMYVIVEEDTTSTVNLGFR